MGRYIHRVYDFFIYIEKILIEKERNRFLTNLNEADTRRWRRKIAHVSGRRTDIDGRTTSRVYFSCTTTITTFARERTNSHRAHTTVCAALPKQTKRSPGRLSRRPYPPSKLIRTSGGSILVGGKEENLTTGRPIYTNTKRDGRQTTVLTTYTMREMKYDLKFWSIFCVRL